MISLDEFVERLCKVGAVAFDLGIYDLDLRATVAAYREYLKNRPRRGPKARPQA